MAALIVPDGDLKMMRETLCLAQSALLRGNETDDYRTSESTAKRIQHLINEIDRHRPLGSNGKHGNWHTQTCGCKDVDHFPPPEDPINVYHVQPRPYVSRKAIPVRIIETGEEFRTIAECAKHIGGNAPGIADVINGLRKQHKGYTFERIVT
jgi:hypothetical protein